VRDVLVAELAALSSGHGYAVADDAKNLPRTTYILSCKYRTDYWQDPNQAIPSRTNPRLKCRNFLYS
jgi:hypothetical protein